MAHRIEVLPSARRQLAALPIDIQLILAARIDRLADDPQPVGARKLRGMADIYRIRVGDHRVLYSVAAAPAMVLILAVGHRRDVYRRLRR